MTASREPRWLQLLAESVADALLAWAQEPSAGSHDTIRGAAHPDAPAPGETLPDDFFDAAA